MLNKEQLRELINQPKLSRRNIVLILLAFEDSIPKDVISIKKLAYESGLQAIENWNVSSILGRAKGLVVRVPEGWILTNIGKKQVSAITGINFDGKRKAINELTKDLYDLISVISDKDIRCFLNEALSCFETKNYRAAVVLSWVGAMSILYKYVFNNYLTIFNAEAIRRDSKWRPAKTIDDLGRMKEKDFLEILQAISVIGKNVKQELDNCLTLRNACAHPNSLEIGENRVAAHLEVLILNVYSKHL